MDGFESQFGVNHSAHFLIFMLVKDTMLKSSSPDFASRVVNVSSSGHMAGEVQSGSHEFENGNYGLWVGYGQNKTANIYMADEIENRYGIEGLHNLSLHPGGIWTGLQKSIPAETMAEWKKRPNVDNILKRPEQGAATSVLAAVGKEYEGKGRLHLENCITAKPMEDEEDGYMAYASDREKEAEL